MMHYKTCIITILLLGISVGMCVIFGEHHTGPAIAEGAALKLENIPFNGARAYEYLKQLCAIGPRPSGSAGMAQQQKLLADHFQKLGGQVEFQRFRVPHPHTGDPVAMANLIVRWHPEREHRILLAAHYDTLPFPMADPHNPKGLFVGANDNASGVAILMELAHDMPTLDTKYGVDFVLLDAEEYRFREDDRFFIGSEYFAREYRKGKPCYKWGVLLDMVGDANLQIKQERNALGWPEVKPLFSQIWGIAAGLGIREFVAKPCPAIEDDHKMLRNVGGIPCIDIIDLDYPPWHTQGDTPDKCSPLSLAKVGWVIREWLATLK